jgi:PAS domain S-box-containing protein
MAESVLITDTDLGPNGPTVLYANPAFERMTGWPRAEILGRSPRVLQGPETDHAVFAELHARLSRGEVWAGETVNYRRDGTPFVMSWSIAPVRGRGDRIVQYMAVQHDVTARRRAQRERAQMEALIERLMEDSSEGVLVADRRQRIVRASRGAEAVFGWTAGELAGLSLERLIPPHNRPAYAKLIARFAADGPELNGVSERHELTALHRDGHEVPVEVAIGRLETGDGFAAIVRDLSEVKRREWALRESQQRLQALFDLSFQFVGVLAPDGTMLDTNRASLEFGGLTLDQVRGKPFWDTGWWRACAADRERLRAAVATAAAGQFVRFPATVRGGDGKDYTVDFSLKPVFGETGAVTMLIPEGRDITEMVAQQACLARSEARLRNATRIGRMGSWTYDVDSDALVVDAQARSLFGLPDSWQTMSIDAFKALVHEADRPGVLARFHAALAGEADYDAEYRLRIAGQPEWVARAVAEPVRDGAGRVTGLIGMVQDVTEAYRVRQDLIAARDAAQQASAAKSRFLATMGHELRTPLNAINGFSELIATEALGPVGLPAYRDYADMIHSSGRHLLQIIDDILDVTRMETGRLELQEDEADARELIAGSVQLLQAAREDRSFEVDPGPAVRLCCDPRLLRQVILNLGGNAAKFSPAETPVRITARHVPGRGYAIEVRDGGPGIPETARRRMLQPFVQGDERLERQHQGVGLGLHLVSSFLELHGGWLDLDCPPEGGTVASAWLPPTRVAGAA